VGRLWLGVLDHEANDAATEVFRRALADLVPDVQGAALHGLTCERCREGELCPAHVVSDVSALVAGDPDPEIRIKAIKVLWTLAPSEPAALSAVVAAAGDPDPRGAPGRVSGRRRAPPAEPQAAAPPGPQPPVQGRRPGRSASEGQRGWLLGSPFRSPG
jgi:hypothetical protein